MSDLDAIMVILKEHIDGCLSAASLTAMHAGIPFEDCSAAIIECLEKIIAELRVNKRKIELLNEVNK